MFRTALSYILFLCIILNLLDYVQSDEVHGEVLVKIASNCQRYGGLNVQIGCGCTSNNASCLAAEDNSVCTNDRCECAQDFHLTENGLSRCGNSSAAERTPKSKSGHRATGFKKAHGIRLSGHSFAKGGSQKKSSGKGHKKHGKKSHKKSKVSLRQSGRVSCSAQSSLQRGRLGCPCTRNNRACLKRRPNSLCVRKRCSCRTGFTGVKGTRTCRRIPRTTKRPTATTVVTSTVGGIDPSVTTPQGTNTVTTVASKGRCAADTPFSTNTNTWIRTSGPDNDATVMSSNHLTTVDDTQTQNYIILKHNCLRTTVNPTASDMRVMSWSAPIAAKAQSWADQCNYMHFVECDDGFATCGQNIARGYTSWNLAINAWWDEYKQFTLGSSSNVFGNTGHYTQMAWAKSIKVGCGFKNCPTIGNYYVCNYAPAGNVNGNGQSTNNPYTQGATCTACPSGTTCTDALCG